MFILLLHLYADEENYKGSSFNAILSMQLSCLHVEAESELYTKHLAWNTQLGHCDDFVDDALYLRESYEANIGLKYFTHSLYRDSFFISAHLGLEYAKLNEVDTYAQANAYSWLSTFGVGYQVHFKRGYILGIGAYISYNAPFSKSVDANGADDISALYWELSKAETKVFPKFMIAWRF